MHVSSLSVRKGIETKISRKKVDRKSSFVLFCRKDGKWKRDLDELLPLNQTVMLLGLGDVKYDILNYLKAHPNIQIIGMSTKILKKREKRPGLKIKVKLKGK